MKKRNEDLIKHHHINKLAFTSIIIFVIILFIFKTVPEVFSESGKGILKISNILTSQNFDKSFAKKIIELEKLHKDKEIDKSKFSGLDEQILAKSYIVYDVKNDQVIFSNNENDILPLASLTKIVTAITAINLKNRNTNIVIESKLMRQDEKLDMGMSEGQIWKLSDLLKYALVISSNSSMDIIASNVASSNSDFIVKMNDYIKSLGFKNFYFNSASGLDYGEVIGGKGTALEYAKLFAKSYKLIPDIMSYTTTSRVNIKSESKNIFQIPNTNKEASKSVGLLASKTGFTDAAGGNLAIMFDYDIDRPIVIVVLGSTTDGRFKDVNLLFNAIKNNYK